MTNNPTHILKKAKQLINQHGHTTFTQCIESDTKAGYCVGKALMDAANGDTIDGYLIARRQFCTVNGVPEDEYSDLGPEACVGWNNRAYEMGIDVMKCFDRAIASSKGRPLPPAPSVLPYESCDTCGARLEMGDLDDGVCFQCQVDGLRGDNMGGNV